MELISTWYVSDLFDPIISLVNAFEYINSSLFSIAEIYFSELMFYNVFIISVIYWLF